MYTVNAKSSVIAVAEPGGSYQSQTTLSQWVEVLVDCPGCSDLFTYKIPEHLQIKPGDILSVPFGGTQVGGVAIRLLTQTPADLPPEKIREVEDVVSEGFFPSGYWTLLNRVASYYYTPLIQVIRVALPPGLLGKSQRRLRLTPLGKENIPGYISPTAQQIITLLEKTPTADYSYHYIQQKIKAAYRGIRELIRLGLAENYLEPPRLTQPKLQKAVILLDNSDHDLTPRQKEIVEVLRRQGGEMWQNELLQLCSTSTSTLKALVDKGYIIIEEKEILRRETGPAIAGDWAKSLTPAQNHALETITSLTGFSKVLLHGITGSGKTEVYLQAISPLLEQGKSALVLVPEIGLTPQLTDRFRARFGNKVHVYHSALSDGERYDTWRQMLTGEPQIIIGTRSAIFAPLPNLGLIILDEEHDSSFKQDAPIPTYHARTVAQWRAELEHCTLILGSATPSLESWVSRNQQYLSLPERIHSRPLPPVEIVDMRQELNYHHVEEGAPELLRCHYCNYGRLHPPHCPECGSPYLKFFGSGTQRVAQELTKQFPQLKIIRFDSDTTSTKGSHRHLLTKFANGEAHLLVGTQMLTKGLDLPQVTLVGVVAADGLLHLSDYRANERTFQTLTQVAGRAGRGEDPGRVIIQTYTPEHPIIEAVQKHDYQSFAEEELKLRQTLNYPPYGRLILLRLSSLDPIQVQNTAQIIATFLQDKAEFEILGPAPANILRVANRYRWQILLKFAADSLPKIPDWIEVRSLCPNSVSLTIDIDPINIM